MSSFPGNLIAAVAGMSTRNKVIAGVVSVVVVAGAAVGAVAATGGGDDKPAASSPAPLPTTSAPPNSTTPAPSPSPKPAAKNPFTGIGPVPKNPVISVKIDDTESGRPQVGIDKADIVYIEAVEGGLTRLAAIYGTNAPDKVGYVRSTRPSDPDLLLQFGKITAAYSGGAHDSLPRMHSSGITSWSQDDGSAYYTRESHAGDHGYVNVVLDVAKVAKATKTNRPKSIGWTFSSSVAGLRTAVGTDVRTWVSGSYAHNTGTAVEFKYDAQRKKYVRYINGSPQHAADGSLITATNVIVQECRIVSHPQDTDIAGNPSQFTYTVGKGDVSVFRQGKRIDGTWSRAKTSDGTTLTAANGKSLPLAPGNTWVVLVRNGQPIQG